MENCKRCWPWAVVACVLSGTSSAAENRPSELPFRLYQDHLIVVKGSIGGSERLEFLIDTGATQTLVDLKIAKKLRLEITEGVELESFKNSQARKTVVPELRFGPVVIRSARVLAADLSFFSWCGTGIDAIIGLDVLRLSSFSVDYASRRITFGPVADSASTVDFQAVAPLLIVDLKIGSQIARLMVDTGAPRLTLFPDRMQSRLPGFLLKGARTAQSPGGMSQVRDVELAAIRLGPTEWLHVLAFLADVPASSFQDFDGVLAPSSLAVKSIDFDFQRNRLSWEK
jgi:predicted aspartyl protease